MIDTFIRLCIYIYIFSVHFSHSYTTIDATNDLLSRICADED